MEIPRRARVVSKTKIFKGVYMNQNWNSTGMGERGTSQKNPHGRGNCMDIFWNNMLEHISPQL